MTIPTTGNISIKEAAGSTRSIDTEMSAISSGSLVALSAASIQYTESDRGAVATKDTDTAPYGMLEFSGYEHMTATETNYWSTTALEAGYVSEVFNYGTTAISNIKVYAVYTNAGGNTNDTIELWGYVYGQSYGNVGNSNSWFPPTQNAGSDNDETWDKGWQIRFSQSNPGYTVRYSYSQTSSSGSGLSYGFVHTGLSGNATMTTSAVSIDNSANQALAVPNNNVWWGRSHATADSWNSGSNYTADMQERGVMTFHFEKTGSPTYTYARNIEFDNQADSVDM